MFYFTCDRSFSVVVSALALFSIVSQYQARLQLGWVTVCMYEGPYVRYLGSAGNPTIEPNITLNGKLVAKLWPFCRSKMAVSRHLWFHRTANNAIRSENPGLVPNMEWIGCTLFETFAFKLYCDLETGVRGHSRSSNAALFDRAHTTLYSSYSSILNMPLSIAVSEI